MIKKFLVGSGALLLVFIVSFFSVTALLDWICHASDYYEEASHETVQLVD